MFFKGPLCLEGLIFGGSYLRKEINWAKPFSWKYFALFYFIFGGVI